MSIFTGMFRSRDKPQNRTAGSSYSFFFGGSTSGKAVTERTAMQMAVGAAWNCRSDVGLSATGVAGPEPQDGAAAGVVWLGLALPARFEDRIRARRLELSGDRAQIRAGTIAAALGWLNECLAEPAHG